ncbi:uncharacterized protein ISCGN_019907 [Ixodes scapularis]
MTGCCAYGCKSRPEKGIKHFSIPSGKANEGRRKVWLHRIGRKDFNPTKAAKLCENHFSSDQFEPLVLKNHGVKKLKKDALPSIFAHRPQRKQRKPPLQRTATVNGECVLPRPPQQGQSTAPSPRQTVAGVRVVQRHPQQGPNVTFSSGQTAAGVHVVRRHPQQGPSVAPCPEKAAAGVRVVQRPPEQGPNFTSSAGQIAAGVRVIQRPPQQGPNVTPSPEQTAAATAATGVHSLLWCPQQNPSGALQRITPSEQTAAATPAAGVHALLWHYQPGQSSTSQTPASPAWPGQIASATAAGTLSNFSIRPYHQETTNQVKYLEKSTMKGTAWSKDTLEKALKIRLSCGSRGFNMVRELGQPLPAARTLQRHLQGFKSVPGFKHKLIDSVAVKGDNGSVRVQKPDSEQEGPPFFSSS